MNIIPARQLLYFCAVAGLVIIIVLNISVFKVGDWKLSVTYNNNNNIMPLVNLSPRSTPSQKGYMFPLRIPEQLTMSIAHFHQFLNLVNDWNFTGVEPFAYESTFFGLRCLNPQGSMLFSKLFNMTVHNRYLSECMKRPPDPEAGHPVLFEPVIEFLRRSYRKLVLVYFAAHSGNTLPRDVQIGVQNEMNKVGDVFTDCSVAANQHGMFGYVEHLLSKEVELESHARSFSLPHHLEKFQVIQAFCINRHIKISLRDLRDFVLSHIDKKHEVSIIFISWQGRFTHPLVESDVKSYINTCRIPFSSPFHSDFVENIAQRYVDSQLVTPGNPYISVHVRFEKLYHYAINQKKSMDNYLDCCMRRLNSLLLLITAKFNISKGNTLLHWDYSPYGSTSCPGVKCRELANSHIKTVSVKPAYFEPKKFNIPSHIAMISLVEMHALFGGKALVTVGEGSYQYTLIQTIIDRHRDLTNPKAAKELHYGHICIPEEDLHEFTSSLKPKC